MDNDKIIRVLKIILVISMLLFVITVTKYKTNDCQHCSFEVDGGNMKIGSFLNYYGETCLGNIDENNVDFSNLNLSGGVE